MNRSVGAVDSFAKSTMLWKFFLCVVLSVGVGLVGMWLGGAWQGYENISVWEFTPPAFFSGVAKTVVFALLGASLFCVVDVRVYTIRSKKLKNTSLLLWSVQFILMIVLPFLLFMHELYMLAFVVTSLIVAFVSALAILDLKLSPPASLLLLPCIAWAVLELYIALIIAVNN